MSFRLVSESCNPEGWKTTPPFAAASSCRHGGCSLRETVPLACQVAVGLATRNGMLNLPLGAPNKGFLCTSNAFESVCTFVCASLPHTPHTKNELNERTRKYHRTARQDTQFLELILLPPACGTRILRRMTRICMVQGCNCWERPLGAMVVVARRQLQQTNTDERVRARVRLPLSFVKL